MENIEVPVDSTFIVDKYKYKCIKHYSVDICPCVKCDLPIDECKIMCCGSRERTDNNIVIFKQIQ